MATLIELASEPAAHRLGWALIHALWQGVAIAATLAVVLRLLRRRTANLRHVTACAALVALVVIPVVTAILAGRPPQAVPPDIAVMTPEPTRAAAIADKVVDSPRQEVAPVAAIESDETVIVETVVAHTDPIPVAVSPADPAPAAWVLSQPVSMLNRLWERCVNVLASIAWCASRPRPSWVSPASSAIFDRSS